MHVQNTKEGRFPAFFLVKECKGFLRLMIVILCTVLHPIFGACTIELPSEQTAQKNSPPKINIFLLENMKLILAACKGDLVLCYKCQVSRLIIPKLQNWVLTSRFALIINTHINGSIHEFILYLNPSLFHQARPNHHWFLLSKNRVILGSCSSQVTLIFLRATDGKLVVWGPVVWNSRGFP